MRCDRFCLREPANVYFGNAVPPDKFDFSDFSEKVYF